MSSQATATPAASAASTGAGAASASTAASATAGGTSSMETDDLVDPMNDFLPLLPENIKQELFEGTAAAAAAAAADKGTANPCDSAENKVRCWIIVCIDYLGILAIYAQ